MGLFSKMGKKGQITVFIIMGIVLLLGIGVFLFFKAAVVEENSQTGQNNNQLLDEMRTSIDTTVENCVESLMDEYVFEYGISEAGVQNYINNNYGDCIDVDSIVSRYNLEARTGNFEAKVDISDDELNFNVDINYPININSDVVGNINFENFIVDYKLFIDIDLETRNGITTERTTIEKGEVVFTIYKGTVVSNKKLRIKIINFPAESENTKLGPIYFDIYPKEATFTPPAELKFYYDEEFLGSTNEDDIRLGWKSGIYWYVYQTMRYPEDNYIVGLIDMTH